MNTHLMVISKGLKGEYFCAYIFISEFKLLLRDKSWMNHSIIIFL